MPFKFLEGIATADVAIEARGKTLEEAFADAALGMFEVQTDTKKVEPILYKRIEIESEDRKSLLFDWLSELIYLRDIENMFFSKFEVKIEKSDKLRLTANAYGEKIDKNKHELKTEVKGVSYTLMEIEESPEEARVKFILDV